MAINRLDWKATDDCSMDSDLPLIWSNAWTTEGSTAVLLTALNHNEAPPRRLLESMTPLPAKVRQGKTAGDRAETRNKGTVLLLLGRTRSRD
jgi:hypothetical protein